MPLKNRHTPKLAVDFDPENEVPDKHQSDSDSDDSHREEIEQQRAHYVHVGKSKLRTQDAVPLGPAYRGARVSRAALENEDDEGEEEDNVEDVEAEDFGENEGDNEEDEDEAEGLADIRAGESEEDESMKGLHSEFDDPETTKFEAIYGDVDEEIDSDTALVESETDKLRKFVFRGSSKPRVPSNNSARAKRPTAADFMTSNGSEEGRADDMSSDEENVELGSNFGSEIDRAGAPDSEEDSLASGDLNEKEYEGLSDEDGDSERASLFDDDEDKKTRTRSGKESGHEPMSEVKVIFNKAEKHVAATISQAAKADSEKGLAIREQRKAFDSILNLRIRLQKALVAANSFSALETEQQENSQEHYLAAEEAAINLLDTLGTLRGNLLQLAGTKRKRESDSSAAIWASIKETETRAQAHRRKVLDKWSARVRQPSDLIKTRQLKDMPTQSLVAGLEDKLLGSDARLIKRTRIPRSCAPAQAAKKVDEDASIYDDADFYQLLLKELVEQRGLDASTGGQGVMVKWASIQEARVRKQVDRRASKGRKLRYMPIEKLQNFMRAEDRRSWEEGAIDRFFGSLFGQKLGLSEEENGDEMEGLEEEQGLKLFRS